jgi:endonuclease III
VPVSPAWEERRKWTASSHWNRVAELLELRYRPASLGNFEDPLEEAVYILLSRQTTERAYQEAHRALRSRWPSWAALRDADESEICDVIKPAGFGQQKARQLKALLVEVTAESERRGFTKPTLDWLRQETDEAAETYLTSPPGIGPKSARCILRYSLDRESFAVDTHIKRVLDRRGLVPDAGGKVRHDAYEAIVPPRLRQSLHVSLVHHGRRFAGPAGPCAAAARSSASVRPAENQSGRRRAYLSREPPISRAPVNNLTGRYN